MGQYSSMPSSYSGPPTVLPVTGVSTLGFVWGVTQNNWLAVWLALVCLIFCVYSLVRLWRGERRLK